MTWSSSRSTSSHFTYLQVKQQQQTINIKIMGNSSSSPAPAPGTMLEELSQKVSPTKGGKEQKVGIKSGKKICCCCPETKQARDACILSKGEEDDECKKLIELHKDCLRGEGFDVK